MADYAHNYTEKQLEVLEKRFQSVYRQAERETNDKLMDYLHKFRAKDDEKRRLLAEGKITEKQYRDWRYGQMMTGKRWKEMRDKLAQEYTNANELAMRALKHQMPDVFAENANYSTYDIERMSGVDTSYTLYDRQTVDRLLRDNPELLPQPQVDIPADLRWNRQHIQSAIEQGVLQGESIPNIAKRLQRITSMNESAAVRNARTSMTSAQNGGRMESYKRAQALGIKLKKCWLATMDNRVRHEHAMLDGQTVDIDKPFKILGDKIMYPGDPEANGYLVWNCRCTLISQLEGFEHDMSKDRMTRDGSMNYDEWKAYHQAALENKKPTRAKKTTTSKTQKPTQTKKEQAKPKVQKGNNFKDTQGISKKYAKGLSDTLDKCPYDDVKSVYREYQDRLKCANNKHDGGSFFRPPEGVHINEAKDAEGGRHFYPYENTYHEFGHNIDWLMAGGKGNKYASNKKYNGKRLMDTIQSDYDAFKKSKGATDDKELIQMLKDENMTLRGRANISDVLEGVTKESYPLGAGHGRKYHEKAGVTENEFFAEVLDSAVTNPESFEQMQRIFPNSVQMVRDIIGGKLK